MLNLLKEIEHNFPQVIATYNQDKIVLLFLSVSIPIPPFIGEFNEPNKPKLLMVIYKTSDEGKSYFRKMVTRTFGETVGEFTPPEILLSIENSFLKTGLIIN